MNQKSFGVFLLSLAAIVGFGCASGQQLQSIAITPSAETFLAPDPSATVQLRALGTYAHPPATKDLTSQATWTSNTPQVAVVSSTGVLSPSGGGGCGGAIISASVTTNDPTGNVVVGTMTATVDNAQIPTCPQP